MSVLALSWTVMRGSDVHGVAGSPTRALIDDLWFHVDDPATGTLAWKDLAGLRAVHPGAAPDFRARFNGASDAQNNMSGHGVRVDAATGVVTTLTGWPTSPALRTFLIEATVANVSGAHAPLSMRIHLHQAIQDLWLTPDDLIIRPGRAPGGGPARDAPQRFTVMARFDDGTVGDVTEDVPSWTTSGWSATEWSSPPPGPLPIDPSGGWVWSQVTSGWWTVTLALPPLGTGPARSASADVGAADSWGAPREAVWVGGRGPDDHAEVPNVLFVAEGFTDGTVGTADERPSFDAFVGAVVKKLGTSAFVPLNHVLGELNFWCVFIPSWASGTTICTEHALSNKALSATALTATAGPVPAPVRPAPPLLGGFPPGHAGTWTLEEMIHEIGLPIPVYESPPPTAASRLADWQSLYDPNLQQAQYDFVPPPAKAGDPTMLEKWLALGERVLLEQASTAFGVRHGAPPTMEATSAAFPRVVTLNPRRASQADLDELLGAITYQGKPIPGAIWGPKDKDKDKGKDRGLACLLSRSRAYGGVELPEYFAASIGSDVMLPSSQDGPRWRVDQKPAPSAPFLLAAATARVVAHECGHALGLEDEYGGNGAAPAPSTPDVLAGVEAYGNLLHATTVTTPAGRIDVTPQAGPWPRWAGWPRITKAGLTYPLSQTSPGDTDILMADDHTVQFKAGDTVMLRTRDLFYTTGSGPTTPRYSAAMTVRAVDLVGEAVTLTAPVPGAPSDVFPGGSVLIGVVLDANGQPLPLLSQVVRDHLERTNHPVNRRPGTACTVPILDGKADEGGILWAVNLPAALLSPTSPYAPVERIVGLYDGGMIYNCGVYHPTGACLMRGGAFQTATGASSGYTFCHVCRYVLVDRVDPRAHAAIDGPYARKHYPR